MSDKLEVDTQWVVATLTTICTQQATAAEALLNIDEHLRRQNDAIAKGQERGANHELRLLALERRHENERTRWRLFADVALKVGQGLLVPLALAHVFGIV